MRGDFVISNHEDRREREYALVTTHSLIPKCADVKHWKIEFLSSTHIAEETLDKYVHSVVSCCGKENSSCSFVKSGPSTALENGFINAGMYS